MRGIVVLAVIGCSLVALGGRDAFAAALHVAANGQDGWSGLLAAPNAAGTDGPLGTLEGARDAIRRMKQAGGLPAEGVTVWVGPGVYTLTKTFALEAVDSGTPESPVVYRASQRGQARLLGGVVVPPGAFSTVTDASVLGQLDAAARGRVLQVSLGEIGVPAPGPEWDRRFRGAPSWPELFQNQQRMTLARWPNEGWAHVADLAGGAPHRIHGVPGDKIGLLNYEGDRPERWGWEKDLWLHGYWFWDWSDQRQRVERIDPARKTIALSPPYHHYGYRKGARYYAFNALSELDSPGEWYIDRETWTLYFWPPAPLADSETTLSLLGEPLVRLAEVSHVTLQGLSFEVGRGEGLQVQGGTENLIAGCTFRNLSQLAVDVAGGTKHGVQSCDMYGLGAGGIVLSGGDRNTLTPCGHYADNNHIHHFAQLVYTYQNAIRLNGVGCRMSHNLVHDTIHEALAYSGNDHLVELNEVHSVCLEADDSGVIHQGRDWTWRGNIIRHNFFHDITAGSAVSNMGVYLDDMECGVQVYGNVLYRIPRAILAGGGRDNIIQNNLIIDCPIALSIDNRAMNWAGYHVGTTMKSLLDKVPYREEPWRTRYPSLVNIWEDEPATPKGNVVRSNVSVRSGPFSLAPEVTRYGTVEGNATFHEDPGFVDAGALDFRLKDLDAIREQAPDFQPIPFESIGVYLDEYRLKLPVGMPVITPAPASFVERLSVTLGPGRGDRNVTVRYTVDGSDPTPASPVYAGPLELTETTTVKATAFALDGAEVSGVSVATFRAFHLGPDGGFPLALLTPNDVFCYGGAVKVNSNMAGSGPASLAGHPQATSLLMHPQAGPEGGQARATFSIIDGLDQSDTFSATIGVEDAMKPNGSCVFIVEVEREGAWERVFESGVLRGGQSQAISVPIKGATKLRLVTTDAGDNIHCDHAVWGEPMLR